MLVDDFLPAYDVSDSVATVAAAGAGAAWDALTEVDLIEVGRRKPVVGMLGGLRMLPDLAAHALHGEHAPDMPASLKLGELVDAPPAEGGWILLGERPGEEIALGLVGKFWRPVIEFAEVGPGEFKGFAEPGYAKTVYSLSVRRLEPGRTLLSGVMRTATTDEHARRWFRRYWTFGVGSGAHLLVDGLLDLARERAEAASAAAP
jgi:hypothetical protein